MDINQTSRGSERGEMNECHESIYTMLCTRTSNYSVNAVTEQFRLNSTFHIIFLNVFLPKN